MLLGHPSYGSKQLEVVPGGEVRYKAIMLSTCTQVLKGLRQAGGDVIACKHHLVDKTRGTQWDYGLGHWKVVGLTCCMNAVLGLYT